jgi:hypothetical protein
VQLGDLGPERGDGEAQLVHFVLQRRHRVDSRAPGRAGQRQQDTTPE